jgi:peroxiredoxin
MLIENRKAPDFTLPFVDGNSGGLQKTNDKSSVLVFYKFSCPTCQLALPFLQKIYDAYGDAFNFLAIAQDNKEKTTDFRKEYDITIPTLLDLPPYPVSQEYELVTVPSIFLIDEDRSIRYSGEGFVKQELLNLADVLAEKAGRSQIDLFANANVPEFKPG